jgi:CBS domain-containing protein
MLEHKVSGLPVVDENKRPLGIITESDIFRMLIDRWDTFTTSPVEAALPAPSNGVTR